MKDDRGELDLTKQVEDKDELIKELRQRVNELLAINKSHQQLLGRQIQENEVLKKDNKAKIKGINFIKKHEKTTKEKKGGIITKENFIDISNVKILDTSDKKTKSVGKK